MEAGRRRANARRTAILTCVGAFAVTLAVLVSLAADRADAAPAACTQPVFTDGLSQAVFASGTANYINEQGWVEAPFDSDSDGKPDRIHFDVSRPLETGDPTCNLKVPVIFEDSPYYANLGPSRNWAVDHELGSPPASRAAEPYFTASNTNPTISTIYESTWLPRGYAVMHAESPGTGNSDGCPTSGAPNETLAGKAVIDWLNGRATAYTTRAGTTTMTADWATGKVGMMGTSYNGTIPEGVATTGVEGLEAIVPISAISNWYEYYRANGMVRAPYTFQGEDLDVLEDAVYSRADEPAPQRLICQNYIRNVTQNGIDRATGDYNAFWDDRNYMKNVGNVHAAALIAHGNMDLNVMTKNFDQFYSALRAQGVPHMLYFHRGGHGGAPPDVMINRWFTRYLYGVQNGVENQPRAWVVREANACPARQTTAVGDQSNTTTLTVADSSQLTLGFTLTIPQTNSTGTITTTTRTITSIPDATHVVLSAAVATAVGQKVADGAIVNHVCGTGAPTPYAEWPAPDASVANVDFTTGGLTSGGLTFQPGSAASETLTDAPTTTMLTLVNASSNAARLLYKSPVLTKDVRISGTVHVSLWMAFSKPRANLTTVLVDLPGTGTLTSNSTFQERSTRGWLDPENRGGNPAVSEAIVPGQFYRMYFDLQPKDLVAVAGRRLGVMIVSSDQESSIRPAAGTQLTLDLSQSWAEIPVVGGAKQLAEAFGNTAPTVAYTLAPPDPTGANGWYTGDVSLNWQVGDGGAAVTKTGCADETFSSDGTFTRSCTASNVVGSTGPVSVTVRRDATAPTTTASVAPPAPDLANGWYGSAPTVTLTPSDATSGLASTKYTIDGGAPQTYSAPFSISTEGSHAIQYWSTDNAGNQESPNSLTVKLDLNAPVTTATLTPGIQNGWYASPTLTLTGDDGPGSGVNHIDYAIDGGSSEVYSGPLSGFSTGNHFVQYRSTDNAGRVEAVKLIAFKVDADPPTVNITRPKDGDDFKLGQVVKANYKCADKTKGSGLDSCVGTLPEGSPIDTSTVGDHTFTVTGTDKAGNVTTVVHSYHVRSDSHGRSALPTFLRLLRR